MKNLLFFLIILVSIGACSTGNNDDKALATYKSKSLYLSDVQARFPENIPEKDSLKLLKRKVENWLSRQLLYERAMSHQLHDKKAIEQEVQQYRQNLVIHRYKTRLLKEKIDTTVTFKQIKSYYEQHSNEFRLRDNIVKIYFVKLPKSVPNAYRVKRWIEQAENKDKLIKLKEFSYQNARYYEFDNSWIKFSRINKLLPKPVKDEQAFLESYSIYHKRDSLYWYFMRINEFLLKGDIAPMEYIIPKIKQIILSKRKLDFINELENNLKREAHNEKKIQINI